MRIESLFSLIRKENFHAQTSSILPDTKAKLCPVQLIDSTDYREAQPTSFTAWSTNRGKSLRYEFYLTFGKAHRLKEIRVYIIMFISNPPSLLHA